MCNNYGNFRYLFIFCNPWFSDFFPLAIKKVCLTLSSKYFPVLNDIITNGIVINNPIIVGIDATATQIYTMQNSVTKKWW